MSELFELAVKKTIDNEQERQTKWIDNLHIQLEKLVDMRRAKLAIQAQILKGVPRANINEFMGKINQGLLNN